MSPSWLEPLHRLMRRDAYEILLAPYRVEFSHTLPGHAPEHLVLERNNDEDSGWAFALASMNAGLERLAWRDADVRVRLSNHFVRYALVPGLAKVRARDERMLVARHQLVAVYGERAQRWQVALTDSRGAQSAIAAGAEQELLQELLATVTRAQLRVSVIEPLLAGAFNALRHEIRKAPTWLCLAEPGRVALAYFENLHWRFLQTERQRGDLADTLRPLLERACMANNASPGRVWFVADAPLENRLAEEAGWSLEWRPLSTASAVDVLQ